MYYPIGWPKILSFRFRAPSPGKPSNGSASGEGQPKAGNRESGEKALKQIVANTDRSLLVILTKRSVHIWYCKPSVEIVCHVREDDSLEVYGQNQSVNWRPDSTMIVIRTVNNYLLFYKVAIKNTSHVILEQTDINTPGLRRESADLFISEQIPALFLILSFSTKINPGISSILAAEEEVVVATKTNEIIGVNWDGTLDTSFQWKLNEAFPMPNHGVSDVYQVTDIKYSSMIGGFSLVFANGKVAFMPLQAQQTTKELETEGQKYGTTRLQFVADVDNGVTSAINHKYQLIAFGLRNTEGVLCCIDDVNSTVHVTHRLVLASNTFPDAPTTAGALNCLQWSPDSTVLASAWEKGGFGLWSVFGALLMCSLSWDYGLHENILSNQFIVSSLSWGKEGYQLWMTMRDNEIKEGEEARDVVTQMSMAKSVLASNPSCMSTCGELVLLVAEDRLFLGVGATVSSQQQQTSGSANDEEIGDNLPSTNACSGRMQWEQQPVGVGNHQWIVIQMPTSYLSTNWPVRYAAIDESGQRLAIAGRSGMAHYSLVNRKWKLFGNETQEKDFEVCGGLIWWRDYVVLSCYNVVDSTFEIRAYPQHAKLDNQFGRALKLPTEVLLMSLSGNRLLALLIDGTFQLVGFYPKNSSTGSTASHLVIPASLQLVRLNQIMISNLMVPPESVTSLMLTSLHVEVAKPNPDLSESLLMNVCGRLFFLEEDPSATSTQANDSTNNNSNGNGNGNEADPLVYKAVSILASGVENVWVSRVGTDTDRPHLTEALWLSCGSHGMGVWLPLLPCEAEKSFPLSRAHNFMSKRIMLPINTHIYPLAVLFRDAVVLGAENDTIFCGRSCPLKTPYSVVSRTSQVYLHHILRQLLQRNLGIHAWEIASSCSSLPHFPHSLELLLHEVLEEEATSSQPIPDALLPRIIDFIREFPVFLETVVHCARKTELALWPHLFAVVGNPKNLFQKCLDENKLETAASYIIILQNMERTSVSRQYTTLLLDAALNSSSWQLYKDLLRFLRAIDPCDVETPPSKASVVASHPHSMKCVVSPSALPGDPVDVSHHHQQQQQQQQGRKRTTSSSNALTLHTLTGSLSGAGPGSGGGPQSPPIQGPSATGSDVNHTIATVLKLSL